MKRSSHFAVANIIGTVIAIVLLLLLFIFPGHYLQKMTQELDATAEDTTEAVLSGDWQRARRDTLAMRERFDRSKQPIKLFLNHEDIDELEAHIYSAVLLAQVEEGANLLDNVEHIRNAVAYLEGIETFNIFNLF
ncbi:MAG: DUF4363 family protein [Clostridia bacterium]